MNRLTPYGYVLVVLILVFTTGFGYLLAEDTSNESRPNLSKYTTTSKKLQNLKTKKRSSSSVRYNKTEKYHIQKGDTFEDVIERFDIGYSAMQEMVSSSKQIHDITQLNIGQPVYLLQKSGNFVGIEYEIDDFNKIIIRKKNDKFITNKKKIHYKTVTSTASGTISSSLFKTGKRIGLSETLILDLAEIFAWNIDFAVELKQGNKFKIIYEKKRRNNKVRTGDILAAKFINNGKEYTAFLFEDNKGEPAYFDKNGHSLKRQFLKAPLEYNRISSGYTNARFHPTLNKTTPHKAIDYAAEIGTPIRAVGDGTITYSGYKSGFGKYIDVRHSNTYQTQYAHLSQIAVDSGQKVSQGEVIGYVGSTGFSTGPHLHYQIKKNGRKVNPLEVELPEGDPVPKDKTEEFKKIRDKYKGNLDIK